MHPVVILVRPQMGENIGAAARAMLNFGLTDMRLVAPRDGWPNPRAVAMASGAAGQVLDRSRVFPSLAEAMGDIDVAYATTARGRDLTKTVHTPASAMAEARDLAAAGHRVGLIFGPERAGLDNEDVARATAIITVPVNPAFPSLNLAQAVLLLGYEWGRDTLPSQPTRHGRRSGAEDTASRLEVERLADHWEGRLERARFFFPADKAASMRLTLRNMWSRMPLTRGDVQILHGMLRQLTWGRDTPGGQPPTPDDHPRDAPQD
ncbi:RNA methyltransferase [uncultured Paracoccus sp.]|uniref:RNA methyltransferase n=1 Tax=uncultured Paracoccus sp. TaxID=189685 RepID=UPI00260CD12E|nr:RNA methyltransferase [uncultured Paracoccus sp.]